MGFTIAGTILTGWTYGGSGGSGGAVDLTGVAITKIATSAFFNNKDLTSIIIPKTVISIETSAFAGCTNLTSVTIHDGLTIIGACTFMQCTSLVTLILPNTLTQIDNYAFMQCTALTTIVIPVFCTIWGSTFVYCSALQSAYVLCPLVEDAPQPFDRFSGSPAISENNWQTYINNNGVDNTEASGGGLPGFQLDPTQVPMVSPINLTVYYSNTGGYLPGNDTPQTFLYWTSQAAIDTIGPYTIAEINVANFLQDQAAVNNTRALTQLSYSNPDPGAYSPAIKLTNVDATKFITFASPPSSNVTVVMPVFNPSGVATPITTATDELVYIAGLVGNTRQFTMDNIPVTMVFTSSGVTVNGTTYNLGTIIPIGNNGYLYAGTGSVTLRNMGPLSNNPCFLKNAPVLTPSGYKKISTIKEGDLIVNPAGKHVTVTRVLVTQVNASNISNPFIIPKGMYGAEKRLLISPNHRVLVEGRGLIEASKLGLEQEKMSGAFDYYNLELTGWSNMVVAGVTVESLAPVRRITMTMSELKGLLIKKYGSVTKEALASIKQYVRFLGNGSVEVPVMHSAMAPTA